jgi:hypothetical protein
MIASRQDVVAAVRKHFPRAKARSLLDLLDAYGHEPHHRERERVQLAIVKLSEGDEDKLRYFLAVATRDYRDVLFWCDHPEEAKIDTPGKRRRVRELLERLGMKVPRDLDDA